MALSLEASEVLELYQWKSSDFSPPKEDLADELSDVLYWVLLMAHDSGIDLAPAFQNKMAKNATKYPIEKSRGLARKYTEL